MKNIRSGTTFFLIFNVFIIQDENFLWYSLKKSKFSFDFIVYRPMRVSDVISNVTKQNMNVIVSTSTSTSSFKCKICISSIESDVYHKKKIQMFVVNMTFISSREVKKMYISFFGTHEIYIFSLHSMK